MLLDAEPDIGGPQDVVARHAGRYRGSIAITGYVRIDPIARLGIGRQSVRDRNHNVVVRDRQHDVAHLSGSGVSIFACSG